MAYDLIGFQTSSDLRNFHDYLYREGIGYGLADGLVQAFDRTLRAQDFSRSASTPKSSRRWRCRARRCGPASGCRAAARRKLIIGVDRLDYSKGIPERLRAYETLLQNYPEQRRQVTLVQISAPSREDVPEYAEIRSQWRPRRGGSMAASPASSTGHP